MAVLLLTAALTGAALTGAALTGAALPATLGTVGPLVLAFTLALLLALVGTPIAISSARRTGFLDRPGGELKKHGEATPYLGGLAVFVPFLTASALVFPLDSAFLAVLLAATLATLLGLMDDFGAMRAGIKLVGQLVVVIVLLRAGVHLEIELFPSWLNLVLTAFWVLAIMNAVNFLDIMDGLAASAAAIATASFLAIAVLTGELHLGRVSAALLGALIGYLPYSLPRPRARIFLGDAGSLLLGATLASLALALDYSEREPWAVTAPLLALALPCFEVTFTILVRIARRRPPWRGSPDHVALRLRRLGLSVRQVLVVAISTSVVGGCLAIWLVTLPGAWAPVAVGAGALFALALAVALLRAPD